MPETPVLTSSLNPPQLEAVNSHYGPLLILAGAGSGKTRVLTYRMANLIAQGKANPLEILAVTFTNKAAREMESRIHRLLDEMGVPVFEKMWISTFHSICCRILRDEIHLLDYQPFFNIYDASDQLSMIKKVLHLLDINEKIHPAKSFQSRINEAKCLALGPDELAKKSNHLMDEKSLAVYKRYEDEMKKANSLDFGDLLMKTYELFRMYPDILEKYQDRFRFILVDEYQDTNHIQYLLVKMLAAKHRNLCVVGDEDQSIYSWRGADISNILSFESDFPEAKVIKLEENYRSTKTIVEAASQLIKNNNQRKDKTLFTSNQPGEKITVREERNEYEEARYVVQQVEALMRDGQKAYKDFAVFYRTNAQSRVIEDLLRSHSIPYRIVGGVKFYERLEIKDVMSYLKSIMNPSDDVALKRIINTPTRGIGKTTIQKIDDIAKEHDMRFYDAILHAAEHRVVHAGACRKLRAFHNMMEKFIEQAPHLRPSEVYHLVLDETGYALKLKEDNSSEAQARIDNLEELDNAIRQFEEERAEEATLQNFLEEIALISDIDKLEETNDFVTLMTLHISKGLEYPVVFIVGVEEGLFPSARTFDSADPEAVEEERRLAYVGMTRARERLFMTHARIRRVWGQEQAHPPSRFLKEIPVEYLDQQSSIARPKFMDRYAGGFTGRDVGKAGGKFAATGHQDEFDHMPNYEDFGDDFGAPAGYAKGMRVRHPTFGVGSIYEVEGSGDMQKVSVVFSDHTTKKFIVKYARLERV